MISRRSMLRAYTQSLFFTIINPRLLDFRRFLILFPPFLYSLQQYRRHQQHFASRTCTRSLFLFPAIITRINNVRISLSLFLYVQAARRKLMDHLAPRNYTRVHFRSVLARTAIKRMQLESARFFGRTAPGKNSSAQRRREHYLIRGVLIKWSSTSWIAKP